MRMKAKAFVVVLVLAVAGCTALSAASGTWRDGYTAGLKAAGQCKSWDALKRWANSSTLVPPGPTAVSTDLIGGKHSYTNTYQAGLRDAKISVRDEMQFVSNVNSGDSSNFFRIMTEWLEMQRPEDVIPPGHF